MGSLFIYWLQNKRSRPIDANLHINPHQNLPSITANSRASQGIHLTPTNPYPLPTFPHSSPHFHIESPYPKPNPTLLFVTCHVTFSKVLSPAPSLSPKSFPTQIAPFLPTNAQIPNPMPLSKLPKQNPTLNNKIEPFTLPGYLQTAPIPGYL